MENQLFSTVPNSKILTTSQAELTSYPHIFLCFSLGRSFLSSPRKEESEFSKSTLFTKKPLDNSPIQINTDRRDNMAPNFPGSHSTKYPQLQQCDLMRKYKNMASVPPIIRGEKSLYNNCWHHKQITFSDLKGKSETPPNGYPEPNYIMEWGRQK